MSALRWPCHVRNLWELTSAPDIGSGSQMPKAETWQLVFGGLEKMLSKEALAQPIGGQLVRHGIIIRSGG